MRVIRAQRGFASLIDLIKQKQQPKQGLPPLFDVHVWLYLLPRKQEGRLEVIDAVLPTAAQSLREAAEETKLPENSLAKLGKTGDKHRGHFRTYWRYYLLLAFVTLQPDIEYMEYMKYKRKQEELAASNAMGAPKDAVNSDEGNAESGSQ
jgi:hypothetical protein